MEGEHEFTIQSCKQHAVASVPLKQQFFVRNPVPCNIVIVGAGDSFHIAMLAETGPEHKKFPAFQPVKERTISYIVISRKPVMYDFTYPGAALGGGEKGTDITCRTF